ncbi:restriction endonuclease subunit S [Mycoplasmopsis felis]|uniref:restriction endonuclease subunit S n=1 Tax=Mycoplasmopsis felis TaxID=33923 RepID=UPI002B001FDD|nr:restriction endonuclease subunit S [Mycoplasmopsis felis]WQQ03840.1 restriction endonuclease subunit S [Mycoplasmopsis felis]
MKKVLVPRVRFKGFSEEWKEERLENIYSFASEGGTPDTNKDIYYKPGLFYFTKIEDMANKYIYHTKAKISELGLKNSSAWIIPKNNILFSNGATIGNVSINKVDLSTKQGIVGMIIKKKFNLEFIYYLLKSQTFQSKVAEKITVGTIPTVAIFNLKKIELFLSKNIYEQQKIGKLLDQISNLIILEQSKLNKLKQLKETLLQKMFPEGNSKTPRIRFKGFNEEWKEERLENITKRISSGGTPSTTIKKFYNGKIPFLTISDMTKVGKYINNTEKNITSEAIENSSTWLIPKNSLLLSMYASFGKTAINKKEITTSQAILGIILNNNISVELLYYLLFLMDINQYWYKQVETGTQPNLSNWTVSKTLIKLTKNISEQQKIGDFFSKIDTLINLYNSKLNKLKQIKESLLQKMFL